MLVLKAVVWVLEACAAVSVVAVMDNAAQLNGNEVTTGVENTGDDDEVAHEGGG